MAIPWNYWEQVWGTEAPPRRTPARVGMDRITGKMLIGWPHTEQSMHAVLATRFHTRPIRRWVGSFVPHMLGENVEQTTVLRFYWAIATALDLWEPNYRIRQVYVRDRPGDEGGDPSLTSPEDVRQGHVSFQHWGVHRPRAHLGDTTPDTRRSMGLIHREGRWEGLA